MFVPVPSATLSHHTMSIYLSIQSIFLLLQFLSQFIWRSKIILLSLATVYRLIQVVQVELNGVQRRLDWDSSCVGFAGNPSHLSGDQPPPHYNSCCALWANLLCSVDTVISVLVGRGCKVVRVRTEFTGNISLCHTSALKAHRRFNAEAMSSCWNDEKIPRKQGLN